MESTGNDEIKFDLNIFYLKKQPLHRIIVIILNREIIIDTDILFQNADIIICADAGADQYMKKVKENGRLPDLIIGDFDSISQSTLDFYTKKGVDIIGRLDPGISDFEKCLYIAIEKISEYETNNETNDYIQSHIVVIGASGGRIDHTFNIYQISCKYNQILKDTTKSLLYLVGDSSCSLFLDMKDVNIINFSDC